MKFKKHHKLTFEFVLSMIVKQLYIIYIILIFVLFREK